MSSPAHSWRSVWPLWAFRLSSSMRRLGSASALNTSSISSSPKAAIWLPLNLGSRTAACQGTRRPRQATPTAVQVTAFGCFTGTATCVPFAGQLLSQLGAPYDARGHDLRRSRPSRHEDQRARRMITGTVDLVREDYLVTYTA